MRNFNQLFEEHMSNYAPSVELELRELAERSMGSLSLEGIVQVLEVLNPPAEVVDINTAGFSAAA